MKPAFAVGPVCPYHNEDLGLQWGVPELALAPTTTTQTAYQFRIHHAKILSPHPTLSDHEFVMAHLSLESLDESNGFTHENPLEDEEYHRLVDYFDHLSFHPYCWVSKIGSPQIEGIRAFLAQYDPSERPVSPVIIVQK